MSWLVSTQFLAHLHSVAMTILMYLSTSSCIRISCLVSNHIVEFVLRQWKKAWNLRCASRNPDKKKTTRQERQMQRRHRASDEGRWKELKMHSVCQAWCRDRDRDSEQRQSQERRKEWLIERRREMVTVEVQVRWPTRMTTLLASGSCGSVSPLAVTPVFIPQLSFLSTQERAHISRVSNGRFKAQPKRR